LPDVGLVKFVYPDPHVGALRKLGVPHRHVLALMATRDVDDEQALESPRKQHANYIQAMEPSSPHLDVIPWVAAEQTRPLKLRPHASVVLHVAPNVVLRAVDPERKPAAPAAPAVAAVRRHHVVPHLAH
jgi:hypothetical protein